MNDGFWESLFTFTYLDNSVHTTSKHSHKKQTRHNYFVKLAKSDFRLFFLWILPRLDDIIVQDKVAEVMCSTSS